MEAYQGLLRKDDVAGALAQLSDFTRRVPILSFSQAVAERAARLREEMILLGLRPNRRAYDVLIAATALQHRLTLVTRNTADYVSMPGLNLYGRP